MARRLGRGRQSAARLGRTCPCRCDLAVADVGLVRALDEAPAAEPPVTAVHTSRRNLPVKVRAFVDLLAEASSDVDQRERDVAP